MALTHPANICSETDVALFLILQIPADNSNKVLGHALFDLRPHLPLQKPSSEKSCPLLLLSSPLRPQVPAPQLRSLCPNMLRVSLWYDAARGRVHARAEQAWVWYYVQDRIGRPSRGRRDKYQIILGGIVGFFPPPFSFLNFDQALLHYTLVAEDECFDSKRTRAIKWSKR